jgi:hypothetical protein
MRMLTATGARYMHHAGTERFRGCRHKKQLHEGQYAERCAVVLISTRDSATAKILLQWPHLIEYPGAGCAGFFHYAAEDAARDAWQQQAANWVWHQLRTC